jgi:hypothetical protein
MSALDIPPHSRAASRLAVTALALIAGFALASGYLRQVVAIPQAPVPGPVGAPIPEATPAPEPTLQVAEAPPHRVHAAEAAAPIDPTPEAALATADAAPAVDASASAPQFPPTPEPSATPPEPPSV